MSNNLGQLTLYGIELLNELDVNDVSLSDVLTKAQVDTLIEEHMNDLVGTDTYLIRDMNTLVEGLTSDDSDVSEVIYKGLSTEQQERNVEFIDFSNEIVEHNSNNLLMLNRFTQQIDTTFNQIKTTNSDVSDKIFSNFTEMSDELYDISTNFFVNSKVEKASDDNLSNAYITIHNGYQQDKTKLTDRLVNQYGVDSDDFSKEMTTLIGDELNRVTLFYNTTFNSAQTNHKTDFTFSHENVLSTYSTQNVVFDTRFEDLSKDVEVTLTEAINSTDVLNQKLAEYNTTIDGRNRITSNEYVTLNTSTNIEYTRNITEYDRISEMMYKDVDKIDDQISTNTLTYKNEFETLSTEIVTLNTDLLDYETYKTSKDNPVLTGSLVVHDNTALQIGNWEIKSEEASGKVDLKFSYKGTQDITFASFNAVTALGTNPYDRMIAVTNGSEISTQVSSGNRVFFKFKLPNGKIDSSGGIGEITGVSEVSGKYILNIDWNELVPRPGTYYVYTDNEVVMESVQLKMLQDA